MAKKMKHGKRFEEDFIKSIPDRCDVTRLKDAGGWSNATNMRFTSSNPCDFIVWNGKGDMYKIELKSVQGKSLPFSNIKPHQMESLLVSGAKNVQAMFIINFRGVNETYMFYAETLKLYMDTTDRKSLPLEGARTFGDKIEQTLIRAKWRYDLSWI